MEEHRTYPICFEVPEKEIYQCSAEHIVCNVCIRSLKTCPQCRANYGATRVRCRVLELLLDSQEFECKFVDKGCAYICKRSEISVHANSCKFNSIRDSLSLCELLGWKNCKFKLGVKTRAEIFNHFMDFHRSNYQPSGDFHVNMKSTKTKTRVSKSVPLTPWTVLCSLKSDKHSPLFLVAIKINNPTGFMSFMCIQLWCMKSSEKCKAEFSFRSSDTPLPTNNEVLSRENMNIKPFLVSWTLNAFTPKELGYMIKSCPLNVHIPGLGYGENADKISDDLRVKISAIL